MYCKSNEADGHLRDACRDAELKGALLGLGEVAVQQVNEALSGHGAAALPRDKQDLLRGQICDLWRHNNPVRTVTGQ